MDTHTRPSIGNSKPLQERAPAEQGSDRQTIQALLEGDEAAFARLINSLHGPLLRFAMTFVDTRAAAEEIVQETWIGVLRGLPQFDGRSSLKTWIFRILMNQARTRFRQEHQAMRVSFDDQPEAAVDPTRFCPGGAWPEQWCELPQLWDNDTPEKLLLSREGQHLIEQAVQQLPLPQRLVMILRDMDGLEADEICLVLDISEANQRVLLHRARARVRRAIEQYFERDRERSK